MQTITKIESQKYLISALVSTAVVIVVVNLLGKNVTEVVANLIYIPLSLSFLILSVIMAIKFKPNNNLGKAALMLALCAGSWAIAEHVWIVEELVYNEKPFPSLADLFYVIGYLFLIVFSLYYLKPMKNQVNRKIFLFAVALSVFVVVPSLEITFVSNSDISGFELALAALYPILDGIILVPAIIAIILFLKGEVGSMWILTSLAILALLGGDSGFLITQMNDSYYTGHPIEIMFYWSYVLFSFGVYSHLKTFNMNKKKFDNKEDLR